ncbi:Response regulator receiver domain-containing protein [Burkholderiales bacterium 8X]|nr:Response regulator receiver domain-containing protein [Burkholderiales bacterium 8X]
MRVLLVEDDRALVAHLAQVFKAMDSAELVYTAENQQDACEWIEANPRAWDLALIDVFLAAGHGFKVLRQCAGRAAHQRVVLMSSYSREPMRERAIEAGADAFFDKAELGALVDFCIGLGKDLRGSPRS